jgi:hypothetical protein
MAVKPIRTRSPEYVNRENLDSPVNDPGYWPYPKLSGGLQEDLCGIEEPRDPRGYVPKYKGTRQGEEDEF